MTLGKTQLMYYLALKITNYYAMSFSNILKPYLTGRYVRLANTASSAQHNTTQHNTTHRIVLRNKLQRFVSKAPFLIKH